MIVYQTYHYDFPENRSNTLKCKFEVWEIWLSVDKFSLKSHKQSNRVQNKLLSVIYDKNTEVYSNKRPKCAKSLAIWELISIQFQIDESIVLFFLCISLLQGRWLLGVLDFLCIAYWLGSIQISFPSTYHMPCGHHFVPWPEVRKLEVMVDRTRERGIEWT